MLFSSGAFLGRFDQMTVGFRGWSLWGARVWRVPYLSGSLVLVDRLAWCLDLAPAFGVLGKGLAASLPVPSII